MHPSDTLTHIALDRHRERTQLAHRSGDGETSTMRGRVAAVLRRAADRLDAGYGPLPSSDVSASFDDLTRGEQSGEDARGGGPAFLAEGRGEEDGLGVTADVLHGPRVPIVGERQRVDGGIAVALEEPLRLVRLDETGADAPTTNIRSRSFGARTASSQSMSHSSPSSSIMTFQVRSAWQRTSGRDSRSSRGPSSSVRSTSARISSRCVAQSSAIASATGLAKLPPRRRGRSGG